MVAKTSYFSSLVFLFLQSKRARLRLCVFCGCSTYMNQARTVGIEQARGEKPAQV